MNFNVVVFRFCHVWNEGDIPDPNAVGDESTSTERSDVSESCAARNAKTFAKKAEDQEVKSDSSVTQSSAGVLSPVHTMAWFTVYNEVCSQVLGRNHCAFSRLWEFVLLPNAPHAMAISVIFVTARCSIQTMLINKLLTKRQDTCQICLLFCLKRLF